ncbi:hypothetical protein ACFX11_021458 [Malus domestica]
MLRYSDEFFFSRPDHIPLKYLRNKEKVTANEERRFYEVLEASVNELAIQASNKSNMFATKKRDVSGSISLQKLFPEYKKADDFYVSVAVLRLKFPATYTSPTPSSSPPLPPPPDSNRARPKGRSRLSPYIIIVGSILAFIAVTVVLGYCFARRRAVRNNAPSQENGRDDTKTLESLQIDLGTVETATNKFSDNNKLGEGGFGVVFKV